MEHSLPSWFKFSSTVYILMSRFHSYFAYQEIDHHNKEHVSHTLPNELHNLKTDFSAKQSEEDKHDTKRFVIDSRQGNNGIILIIISIVAVISVVSILITCFLMYKRDKRDRAELEKQKQDPNVSRKRTRSVRFKEDNRKQSTSYLNRAYGIVGKEDRPDFPENRLGAPFVLPDFTRANNNDQKNDVDATFDMGSTIGQLKRNLKYLKSDSIVMHQRLQRPDGQNDRRRQTWSVRNNCRSGIRGTYNKRHAVVPRDLSKIKNLSVLSGDCENNPLCQYEE